MHRSMISIEYLLLAASILLLLSIIASTFSKLDARFG